MAAEVRQIALVTTLADNLWYFYGDLVPYFSEFDFQLVGISSPGEKHAELEKLGVEVVPIPVQRQPHLILDIRSLVELAIVLRRRRFFRIVVSTPKAALLGTLAAAIGGRRRRVTYICRGRAYENFDGLARWVYGRLEWLTCALSDRVISISPSLTDQLIEERLVPKGKVTTLGSGSSHGVNTEVFKPAHPRTRASSREEFGFDRDAVVLGYMGWLRREKGLEELLCAFERIAKEKSNVHLVLIGKDDFERDPIGDAAMRTLADPRVHSLGWQDEPSEFLNMLDIFVFPSYREGFGNAALEAAACGLPVVASDILGLRDAVSFGETAVPIKAGSCESLVAALNGLIEDAALRTRLAKSGVDFAQKFATRRVAPSIIEALTTE